MPAGKTMTVADYAQPAQVDSRVIDDIATWVKAQPAHARQPHLAREWIDKE